jgi:hypothetical protein
MQSSSVLLSSFTKENVSYTGSVLRAMSGRERWVVEQRKNFEKQTIKQNNRLLYVKKKR